MAPKSRRSTGEDFARGEVLYLGIDLGTSRCAIAASNRRREWVESYVGWPKDFVSRNVVKKPLVLGEECNKYRTSLEVIYPLDKTLLITKNKLKNKVTVHKYYGDLPKIHCSPSQINQVFLNLLTNAADAINESGDIGSDERDYVPIEGRPVPMTEERKLILGRL